MLCIIQNSAGSGKATEINRRILPKQSLLASIKCLWIFL